MRRRNRSPGLGALALLATLTFGLPVFAIEIERTIVPARSTPDHSDTAMAQGLTADATVVSQRSAAIACRTGKRVIGTSSSYVLRASIKSAVSDCYSCCSETIFIDDFETGDTSAWSSTVGE